MVTMRESSSRMKRNALVSIVAIILVAAPSSLSLPSTQTAGEQQEGSYAHGFISKELGSCGNMGFVPNVWSGLVGFSQRAKQLGGVKDMWRRTEEVFKRFKANCQGSSMNRWASQAWGLPEAAWNRILEAFPGKEIFKRCWISLSSHAFIKDATVALRAFSSESVRIWRTDIFPIVEKTWVEVLRLCNIVYKKARSIFIASLQQTRIRALWAAKHADRHLFRMHVWISQKEASLRKAFASIRPSFDKAAAKIAGFLGKLFSQTGKAAKIWQSFYKLCILCTNRAREFWCMLSSRTVAEHRRLAQWHRKVLRQSPTVFVTSWVRSMRKAMAFMIPGAFSKGGGYWSKASTGRQGEKGSPRSAWWAGPPVEKDEQVGTNSWMELKKIVLAWSAASERKESAKNEHQEDKELSAAVEWFITQSSGGPTAKDEASRYLVLRHSSNVFLLLSLDSNGWFRHVATAAKQQSSVMYPSGIAQPADHVAAADLVDMLRDQHSEKPLGKLPWGGKLLGNWRFKTAGSAIVVTNVIHEKDPASPKLVLTSDGFIFAGYSEGVKETVKQGRVVLTKDAARQECQKAIAASNQSLDK